MESVIPFSSFSFLFSSSSFSFFLYSLLFSSFFLLYSLPFSSSFFFFFFFFFFLLFLLPGKALQERVDLTGVNFAGSSAGSLVSVCLLIGVDFDDLMDYTVSCVERCRFLKKKIFFFF